VADRQVGNFAPTLPISLPLQNVKCIAFIYNVFTITETVQNTLNWMSY